jgi:hypothetical protein
MTNKTITGLTGASTPLAGTEEVPIWQSGASVKATVADITSLITPTSLSLVIGTNVQAYDADLTTWAGITPGANVGTFLATPSSANLAAALTDETGTGAAVFANAPQFQTGIGLGATAAGAGGIAFPATAVAVADANTLDDYEEGTWTPSLGGTATYLAQGGRYTKIGRIVNFQGVLYINLIGTGSTTQ